MSSDRGGVPPLASIATGFAWIAAICAILLLAGIATIGIIGQPPVRWAPRWPAPGRATAGAMRA